MEIGSHLGGSLQTHVLDDRCERIFSIDKRPTSQPDARGQDDEYPENSTDRMLGNLKRVSLNALQKISCFDDDSASIDPALISPKPQVCFIDGEHTDRACVRDAEFCLKVIDRAGLLVFHDACVVYNGLAEIVEAIKARGVLFHAYNLPENVFVIEINDCPIHKLPQIQELLIDNYLGYLASLRNNDGYRNFSNRAPFRLLRSLRRKVNTVAANTRISWPPHH